MARNKNWKVLRATQLVVLMKILCCSFFVCSNRHSDMKSLNVNDDADYNLGFLLLFNPLFIYLFGAKLYVAMADASSHLLLQVKRGQ